MTGWKHVRRVSDFRAHSLLFGHIRSSFRLSSDIIQDLSGPVKPRTKIETAHEVQIQAQNLGSYTKDHQTTAAEWQLSTTAKWQLSPPAKWQLPPLPKGRSELLNGSSNLYHQVEAQTPCQAAAQPSNQVATPTYRVTDQIHPARKPCQMTDQNHKGEHVKHQIKPTT